MTLNSEDLCELYDLRIEVHSLKVVIEALKKEKNSAYARNGIIENQNSEQITALIDLQDRITALKERNANQFNIITKLDKDIHKLKLKAYTGPVGDTGAPSKDGKDGKSNYEGLIAKINWLENRVKQLTEQNNSLEIRNVTQANTIAEYQAMENLWRELADKVSEIYSI